MAGRAGFAGGVWALRLFQGYDWVTLLVVVNLAFSGLLVSWVMKFADSILKARPLRLPCSSQPPAACGSWRAACCVDPSMGNCLPRSPTRNQCLQ
jgi:hypothetical protein